MDIIHNVHIMIRHRDRVNTENRSQTMKSKCGIVLVIILYVTSHHKMSIIVNHKKTTLCENFHDFF